MIKSVYLKPVNFIGHLINQALGFDELKYLNIILINTKNTRFIV